MKKKILLVGASGKMGTAVCKVLENDYEIIKMGKSDKWGYFSADLIIDFGSAESSVLSAKMASKMRVPVIVGSTGQSKAQLEQIDKFCEGLPYLVCANFSVGISILKGLISQVLNLKMDSICIFEKHHSEKKDSPSGTALMLEKFILKNLKTETKMQTLALRGGKEIGTHKLSFYFGEEVIELSHAAFSRKAFADGVALAVEFMLKKCQAKKYCFDEIIKESLG